ncbi:DUF6115 domain-containing protein [Butyrivibrio proteoclasticus]|uniref:DUF6115 domain-containing protein n=1 Tax=Butyrivibrio proteoclasticus TaxID=43305 RepID=UPI00047B75D5|nr:DUF6115 domain-containing protein [Butyrivibrio proteoclasticus]
MISITEIILIVAGFAAIIIGYLIPAGKEMDEEDKLIVERQIRELVRKEVEDQKVTIENMVDDTVDNSLDRTERAMERISNEKMSAIGEYSDTVINDIHKNHDEVMFMYDMLNDKHKNLTSVVSEVTKKADEAKQVVRDAEVTAKEAQEAATTLKASAESLEAEEIPVRPKQDHVRAILLDEEKDQLSGIRIPYKEKISENSQAKNLEEKMAKESTGNFSALRDQIKENIESGYVDEKNLKDYHELGDDFAKKIDPEEASNLHVIGNTKEDEDAPKPISNKVVPITESIRSEGRTRNPDANMKELTANDPISQNRQIIEMHKAGKSNMVIARELGLGIGEVKLVIDLSNKHRKVK